MPFDIEQKDIFLLVLGSGLGFGLSALSQFVGDVGKLPGFRGKTSVEQEAQEYKDATDSSRALIVLEYFFASFGYLVIANLVWATETIVGWNVGWPRLIASALTVIFFLLSFGRLMRLRRVRAKASDLESADAD
ncbi:MAG: hypothetical protein AAGI14_06160 [Pseudomonadota bacterium]